MKTEQVIADAEVAACFFRALIDKGVPTFAAVWRKRNASCTARPRG